MNPIVIEVSGEPRPQPRARSFILRGKGGKPILGKNGQPILRVHEAGTAEAWKSQVAEAAKPFVPMPPIQGPVRVDIEFRFSRPKAHFRANGQLKADAPTWHIAHRGDRDNLDKAVLDCLTVLGMWSDDSQACAGEITKKYADGLVTWACGATQDFKPGAKITITPLEQPKVPKTIERQPELVGVEEGLRAGLKLRG